MTVIVKPLLLFICMSYIRRRWPIKKTLAYQEDVGLSRRRWPICWCCLDRGPGSFDVEDATTLSWSSAAVSEWVSESYSHKTASSSAECSRDKLPFSFFRGQDLTMWNIIWVSPQGHRSLSVSCHFLLQAPQCPCSVRKRFSRDHWLYAAFCELLFVLVAFRRFR